MFSGYGVPPVRRSPRCAWGWSVAWDAGLPQDALVATQRRNGRAFSSLTARGGGLPVGVIPKLLDFAEKIREDVRRIAPGALRGKETKGSQRGFARRWGPEKQEHLWSSVERCPWVSD